MSEKTCCCGVEKTLIMACLGGSNIGQIPNNIMIKLDKALAGSAYCLTGLYGNLSGFVN